MSFLLGNGDGTFRTKNCSYCGHEVQREWNTLCDECCDKKWRKVH